MTAYQPITVDAARKISREFSKSIVIICAWDPEHNLLHTTTYGKEPQDKINAAKGGDIAAKALGTDLTKKDPNEDFRTVDAARNAQLRDLAPGLINAFRSYQFGNSAPDLAKQMADKLEKLIWQR